MEMFKLQSHISATPPRSKNLTRFKLSLIFLSRFSHRAELHVSFTASEQGQWLYNLTLRKKNQLQESRVRWLLRKVCDSSTKTFVAVWWGESGRTVECAKVSSLVNFIHCEMALSNFPTYSSQTISKLPSTSRLSVAQRQKNRRIREATWPQHLTDEHNLQQL